MPGPIRKGFTLVEILVVIAIIGILSVVGLAVYPRAVAQARDTQRKSDLKQYQSSLEVFANNNNGLYPSRVVTAQEDASKELCGDLGLTTCPTDPQNGQTSSLIYHYQSDGTGSGSVSATRYVLWATLENAASTSYWVVCSNGKVGQATTTPSGGTCQL